MALRLMLTTVLPHGRIGFGRGEKGIRYVYRSDNASPRVLIESRPNIEWIRARDAEQWIEKHGLFEKPQTIQEWVAKLFTYYDRNEPFLEPEFERWCVR